eukprot:CAMPEP_0195288104 /NCGR_PEP_ID=MMETSP0707-20130614/4903_1 /TAXON_ID=33640 /ORGANISM="Asterionellopsis glacialis, Strain CCMP134" /LENGTH=372 /DNA_ID=CAMNT_0040347929 /DNA_START=75 /DNA_END=1193 /DNA_ORIENTATION=-
MKVLKASPAFLATLVVVGLSFTTVASERTFIPQCDGCWCTAGEGNSCPEFVEGIDDWVSVRAGVSEVYASFKLVGESFVAKSENGGDCYPYKQSGIEPKDEYPESSLPQCKLPTPDTDETVCAFKFKTPVPQGTTKPQSCTGREYEVITYESAAMAEEECAVVTHKGPCGVCSSARDLAVMLDYEDLPTDLSACAAVYFLAGTSNIFDTRFTGLQECIEDLGFTTECAFAWAHQGAANVHFCFDECSSFGFSGGQGATNGPPPACELADCFLCPLDLGFQQLFDKFIGRHFSASGIVQDMARPCNEYYAASHDPCYNGPCFDAPTAPTKSPAPSASPAPSMAPSISGTSTLMPSTRIGLFVGGITSLVAAVM